MEAYTGQIIMVGFNYAPPGWAPCDGRLLPIAQNAALYSLLGTAYGGNGTTTFGLPDLRGRVPINQGTGVGLSPYVMGQSAGSESVTLTVPQMPAHNHAFNADASLGGTSNPSNANLAQVVITTQDEPGSSFTTGTPANPAVLSNGSISVQGGSQPHSNLQPFLVVNFIICLSGIYPPRP